jgi:hypothetical protein
VLEGTFEQIAAVLAVCVFAGLLATLLRQPLIVGLIAAGIAVGPQALGMVEASTEIELLAKIGISLLLFVVGLKLDVRLVKALGPVALATGLGQVLFTSAIGYVIAIALGFTVVQSVYIAVALTFSSTIIIVKLLTEKRELDDLHGRIAWASSSSRTSCVVLAMIAITAIGGAEGTDLARASSSGRAPRRRPAAGRRRRRPLGPAPRVTHRLARQPELLVLAAVAWAVLLAAITMCSASARRSAPSSPGCRSPRPRTARRSPAACRRCGTSCWCSSSSTSGPGSS